LPSTSVPLIKGVGVLYYLWLRGDGLCDSLLAGGGRQYVVYGMKQRKEEK